MAGKTSRGCGKQGAKGQQRAPGKRGSAAAKRGGKPPAAKKGGPPRKAAEKRGDAGAVNRRICNYPLHIENQVKTHFADIVEGLVKQAALGRTTAVKLLFGWSGFDKRLAGTGSKERPVSLAKLLLNELKKRKARTAVKAGDGGGAPAGTKAA